MAGRRIYYSRTELIREVLMDWCLILVAAFVIFTSLYMVKWLLDERQIQITFDDVAFWIEDNFKLAVVLLLIFAYITLYSYWNMRENRSTTYRYIPYQTETTFRTSSSWDQDLDYY